MNEGTVIASRFGAERTARKEPLKFGTASRLSDLSTLSFFTPALLYVHGGYDDGPLLRFMEDMDDEVFIGHYRFNSAIFTGFETSDGDKDWNHVLWAVHRHIWPAFESYMISVAVIHHKFRVVCRAGAQDITIADPLFVETQTIIPPTLPTADIVVLGVNGSHKVVAIDPDYQLTGGKPAARIFPPSAEMLKFASAVFANENPLAFEDT
jgi:hypothetical protein